MATSTYTAITAEPGDTLTISALMDAYADSLGRRWAVASDGTVSVGADPQYPGIFLAAGIGDLGVSMQRQVTDLFVTYVDSTSLQLARVASPASGSGATPRMEKNEDLSRLGPMPAAQAQALADGIMAKVGPEVVFSGGVQVMHELATNDGGTPIESLA